jgi:nitrogen regulatory protein PII
LPKLKIQILVPDERAAQVVETVVKAARMGKIGDGRIFITPVEEVLRIRTGEKDADAYLAQTEKKRSMEWAKEKR